jgi:hypothetical protein
MAFLTITIQTQSNSVAQLNQLQAGSTERTVELNQLVDYLARCSGGNEIVGTFYVVTNNSDPNVATDGGSSTKTTYNP